MVENIQEGFASVAVSTEGKRSMSSANLRGDSFVGAALHGLSGPATAKAIEVEPIHNVLGDDSSNSGGGGDYVGGEVVLEECSRPAKAPLVDEYEDESEDGPPPAQPQDLVPQISSHREEDIEMDAAKGILYLSKCFSHFFCFVLLFFACS